MFQLIPVLGLITGWAPPVPPLPSSTPPMIVITPQSGERDPDAILAMRPNDPQGLVRRGVILMDRGRHDEAIADFDRAASLDPRSAWPLANRGMAYVWKEDYIRAERDLRAAAALHPENPVLFRARGMMALQRGDHNDSVAAFTTALAIDPNSAFALGHRARAYEALGRDDEALADSAATLQRNPRWLDLYLLRARIFHGRGEREPARAAAAALAAVAPGESYAHVGAGRIYASLRLRDEAMRAYDRALALEPAAYVYLNRGLSRRPDDMAGRRADFAAAMKLEPDLPEAIAAMGETLRETGDHQGAIATLTAGIDQADAPARLLAERGLAYAKSGQTRLAEQDFAAARAKADGAGMFNSLCWSKAKAGVALEAALGECDRALRERPRSASYLDSRGLVLLRLGRVDEALRDYDLALADQPELASSLFGRAVARRRGGDRVGADQDRTRARAADPEIEDRFAHYGVRF